MNKTIIIVWLLMTSLALSAAEISQQQALDNARAFMLQKRGGIMAASRAKKAIDMKPAETGMPELYAFNTEGGGYVIASADDRTLPVLGYSLTGRFDASRIPDNMRAWLQDYAEQIRMLGNAPAAPAADYDTGMAAIEPLIQTRWGQEDPYNLLTPVDNGNQTLTGCVATALAQVMYYHKWPKAATTDIPAYTYQEQKTGKPVDLQGLPATTFEWDKMLPTYTKDSPGTEEQRQAVAKLMRYCGQAVRMYYGETSVTDTEYLVIVLRRYFDYSKSARLAFRYDYSSSEWRKLIWDELNQKRPVLMSGSTERKAHAFTIDGYDGSGLFHVNWGWDGDYDDYFALDLMNYNYPGPISETSMGVVGYAKQQKVILGVEPSTGSEEVVPEITRYFKMIDPPDTYYDRFSASFLYFDIEEKPAHFELAYGTKDDDGNVTIRLVDSSSKNPINSGGVRTLDAPASMFNLPDGSYKLYPFYRDEDVPGDSWHQIGGDHDYWGVNINGSQMTFFFDQKLKITKAYLEGDEQAPLDKCTLVMEVENEGDSKVFLPTSTLMYGKPNDEIFKYVSNPGNGTGELEIEPKGKTTLRYGFTVPFQGDIEFRLRRSRTGHLLANTTLTVDKEPHYNDIELTDYKVVYKADEKDMTKAVECTLNIKNNDLRPLFCEIYSRIGNDGSENCNFRSVLPSDIDLMPGESDEVEAYLKHDLKEIEEPTDLHLVVMIYYNNYCFVKLLDLNIKPGTTVTSQGTTGIGNIEAPEAPDAPFYDLQGRRVSHPRKGVYIRNGKKRAHKVSDTSMLQTK